MLQHGGHDSSWSYWVCCVVGMQSSLPLVADTFAEMFTFHDLKINGFYIRISCGCSTQNCVFRKTTKLCIQNNLGVVHES